MSNIAPCCHSSHYILESLSAQFLQMEQLISTVRRAEKRLDEVHVRRGYSSKVSPVKSSCSAPTGRLPSVSRDYVQLGVGRMPKK